MRTGRIQRTTVYVLLTLGSLLALIPLGGVLLMALQTSSNAGVRFAFQDAYHVENFAAAWEKGGYASSIPLSLAITLGVLIVALPLSVAAAYALTVLRTPWRAAILVFIVTGIFLPVEAYVVPLFFDLRALDFDQPVLTVILVSTAINLAFGTFWMRSFFLSAPSSLIDAARIDGAGPVAILVRVLLPIARPHIMALAVLMFIWTWNDLLAPLVMLSSTELRTAPMSLAFFQAQNTTNYALLAAAAVITIVPVIVVYVVMQRSFVRGILDGSSK